MKTEETEMEGTLSEANSSKRYRISLVFLDRPSVPLDINFGFENQ